MRVSKEYRNYIIIFLILFSIIQVLTIFVLNIDYFVLILIDIMTLIYWALWLYKSNFQVGNGDLRDALYIPIVVLFSFVLVSSIFTYSGIIVGVLWTYPCFIFGALPQVCLTIYTIYVVKNDGELSDSFFDIRYNRYLQIFRRSAYFSIIIVALIILAPMIHNYGVYLLVDNDAEIRKLVNQLTDKSMDDSDKTIALLNWFDRGEGKCENMANPYYRTNKTRQKDNDVLLKVLGDYYIFSKSPHLCIRFYSDDTNLIYASRCGMCQEYSALFNTIGLYAGLEVRRVRCWGEDHDWNEVKIDGEWIIVDATAVKTPDSTGFNLSTGFMENKVASEWREIGIYPEYGNVSYVYAQYPDKSSEIIDITSRYSDIVNVTIRTVDSNKESIPNVNVKVYSLNSAKERFHDRVILEKKTNETGFYTFTLGDGKYRFSAEKGDLKSSKTFEFSKYNQSYNKTIQLI